MKLVSPKRAPLVIAATVILLIGLVRWLEIQFIENWERTTFDLRVRTALSSSSAAATNLRFVYIDDATIDAVISGSLGYRFGLYWPRQVYGRLVQELAARGAKAIAMDVIFGESRPDHWPVQMQDGSLIESDEFFALQLSAASNVILAVTQEVTPPSLFLTNAFACADIFTDKDPDGILRRAKAFRVYRYWHPVFRQLEEDPEMGVDLDRAIIESRKILLPRPPGLEPISIPLDEAGQFELADFVGDDLPADMPAKTKPFTEERIWHMGIVLAARELGLDLNEAKVDLHEGRIELSSPSGIHRVVPVDGNGFFFIDWSLPVGDPRLRSVAAHALLRQNQMRASGTNVDSGNDWTGMLAIVGSSAMGNDLTDRGATPLGGNTLLVSKHWNVANSVITGRFVRKSSLMDDLVLIALLGSVAAVVTWRFRALTSSAMVLALVVVYGFLVFLVYTQGRYWLPLILPVGGALLMTHVCLITWKVTFEEADKRRVRAVFSTVVSPKIVQELLQAETLPFGGARREISVLFADVRGFTTFTDTQEARAEDHVRMVGLTGQEAKQYFDEQARETLDTINLYLGLVADQVIRHEGTLDKFIGDCVMAFWGAPAPEPSHAAACVRAAIDAQRAVFELNQRREEENNQRVAEVPSRPPLPLLYLGTGVSSGMMTVGLLGADAHENLRQGSYTVFGREVNVAQRLESLSGSGRIYISASTYQLLQRDEPELAAACVALPPVTVKGIGGEIQVYDVCWHQDASDEVGKRSPVDDSRGFPQGSKG